MALTVRGCGDLVVTGRRMTSDKPFTVVADRDETTVTFPGSGMSITRGSIIGSMTNSFFGGSYTASGGDSTLTINGRRVRVTGTGDVYVDGRCVDRNDHAPAVDPALVQSHTLTSECRSITVLGTSTVHATSEHIDQLTVHGSGDIFLVCIDTVLDTVTATVTGSGDISLGNTRVCTGVITVTGSGGITGGHFTTELRATVSGSGGIRVKADKDANVRKSVTGSGCVDVRKARR